MPLPTRRPPSAATGKSSCRRDRPWLRRTPGRRNARWSSRIALHHSPRRTETERGPRVPRDHEILVSRDDADRARAGRHADGRGVARVVPRVESDAQVLEPPADLPADGRGALSDPAREDQRVETIEDGRERADVLANRITEGRDGVGCAWIRLALREQCLHVRRGAGDAEQTRLRVDEPLEPLPIVALVPHQVEEHTRVEIAGARAHD